MGARLGLLRGGSHCCFRADTGHETQFSKTGRVWRDNCDPEHPADSACYATVLWAAFQGAGAHASPHVGCFRTRKGEDRRCLPSKHVWLRFNHKRPTGPERTVKVAV